MIFETHAHYDDEAFKEDREELFSAFQENQITHIVNVAADVEGIKDTLALTEKYPYVYGTVGVHPNETEELNDSRLSWMKELCSNEKIVAVGEIGLDYYYDKPHKETQKYWFEKQLILARDSGLPIIIHSRDAAKDTLDILQKYRWEGMSGVIHCFSYGKEMAREFEKMGFFFGIGGVITFSNAKKLKEAVKYIPLENMVLETDSPYLAPVPFRGKRNTSLNLPVIAKEIAAVKNMTYEQVIAATYENARRLYRL